MKYPNGYFLVVEGGEGVGKSTQVERLTKHFEEKGHSVVHLRAPGSTVFGEQLRTVFKDNVHQIDGLTQTSLMVAGLRDLVRNAILPALDQNKIVICDRYYLSTYVYQSRIGGVDIQSVKNLLVYGGVTLHPHRSIVLSCSPEVSVLRQIARVEEGGEFDNAFDSVDVAKHERYHTAYKDVVDIMTDWSMKAHQPSAPSLLDTTARNADEVFEYLRAMVDQDLASRNVELVTIERHGH